MDQQKRIFSSPGISNIFSVIANQWLIQRQESVRKCWSSNNQLQLHHQLKIFDGFYVVIFIMRYRLFLPYLKMTYVIIKRRIYKSSLYDFSFQLVNNLIVWRWSQHKQTFSFECFFSVLLGVNSYPTIFCFSLTEVFSCICGKFYVKFHPNTFCELKAKLFSDLSEHSFGVIAPP